MKFSQILLSGSMNFCWEVLISLRCGSTLGYLVYDWYFRELDMIKHGWRDGL